MSDFFSSMLSAPQWLLLSLVPPAIVALYFLKLRRQPLEVPSTYLWRRTIEDMHVNSLWQRLRQNLLLFLQLLIVGLLMLACLRPSWQSQTKLKNRLIFLIDVSASMSATDVSPSRLDKAKEKVDDLIEQMAPGDVAMLITFSDRANVAQPFTTNKGKLRSKLQNIQSTERTSDISEALRVAAGLANPGRSGEANGVDVAAAEALPADVFILSDGGFDAVPDFSWGNLEPIYLPMGLPSARNLAVSAFNVQTTPNAPDRMEAFVEIQSFSTDQHIVTIRLLKENRLLDAAELTIPPNVSVGTRFQFDRFEEGTLAVRLDQDDDLAADNRAYVAINPSRRAQVLLATPGNQALKMGLSTESALKLAETVVVEPAALTSKEFQSNAAAGDYDLIIFDRCRPEIMPNANTWFMGATPIADGWRSSEETLIGPQIIDLEQSHPLMKYLVFGDVRIAQCRPVEGPAGSQVLLDSDLGALAVIAPRDGFEDLVLGFEIFRSNDEGDTIPNTDWPIRASFPLFCKNALEYLANAGSRTDQLAVLPGQSVALRLESDTPSVEIVDPRGESTTAVRDRNNAYSFSATDRVGIYEVQVPEMASKRRFAVNLFDSVESRIEPQEAFNTAWNRVEAATSFETARRDAWRWILLLAVAALIVEWYIYNRRVYL